jgi:hypothetical protein
MKVERHREVVESRDTDSDLTFRNMPMAATQLSAQVYGDVDEMPLAVITTSDLSSFAYSTVRHDTPYTVFIKRTLTAH